MSDLRFKDHDTDDKINDSYGTMQEIVFENEADYDFSWVLDFIHHWNAAALQKDSNGINRIYMLYRKSISSFPQQSLPDFFYQNEFLKSLVEVLSPDFVEIYDEARIEFLLSVYFSNSYSNMSELLTQFPFLPSLFNLFVKSSVYIQERILDGLYHFVLRNCDAAEEVCKYFNVDLIYEIATESFDLIPSFTFYVTGISYYFPQENYFEYLDTIFDYSVFMKDSIFKIRDRNVFSFGLFFLYLHKSVPSFIDTLSHSAFIQYIIEAVNVDDPIVIKSALLVILALLKSVPENDESCFHGSDLIPIRHGIGGFVPIELCRLICLIWPDQSMMRAKVKSIYQVPFFVTREKSEGSTTIAVPLYDEIKSVWQNDIPYLSCKILRYLTLDDVLLDQISRVLEKDRLCHLIEALSSGTSTAKLSAVKLVEILIRRKKIPIFPQIIQVLVDLLESNETIEYVLRSLIIIANTAAVECQTEIVEEFNNFNFEEIFESIKDEVEGQPDVIALMSQLIQVISNGGVNGCE